MDGNHKISIFIDFRNLLALMISLGVCFVTGADGAYRLYLSEQHWINTCDGKIPQIHHRSNVPAYSNTPGCLNVEMAGDKNQIKLLLLDGLLFIICGFYIKTKFDENNKPANQEDFNEL